jgi:MraZ protein
MLIGEYRHSVDPKGRLAIPSKFRQDFCQGLILTKGVDTCLFGFVRTEWDKVVEKITKLPISQANSRAFARLLLAGAFETEVDKQGRILIPEHLRKYANIVKRVVIVGVYSRIEIWDEKKWEEYRQSSEDNAEEIAEHLGDLGI